MHLSLSSGASMPCQQGVRAKLIGFAAPLVLFESCLYKRTATCPDQRSLLAVCRGVLVRMGVARMEATRAHASE